MTRRFGLACACLVVACAVMTATACRRASGTGPTDPLLDVFSRHGREEGLTRVQTEGKRLFGHYCATCHGDAGQADGQNAYNLNPKPPDFRESLKTHPRSYWRGVTEGGSASMGRSPLCPPRGRNLTPSELDAVVAYLSVLATPAPAAKPTGAARR